MRLWTRVSASLAATTNAAVAQFENHEAVGAVALERCRRSVADARAAVRRHERTGEALAERQSAAIKDIDDWTRRASAAQDDATALDCLERRRQTRERLDALDKDVYQHGVVGATLAERLRDLEVALARLTARHADLASRDALARAGDTSSEHTTTPGSVFDRWETAVEVAELRADLPASRCDADITSVDPLAARFAAEERSASLRDELAALRRSEKDS